MEQVFKYYNLKNYEQIKKLISLVKENIYEKDEIFDLSFLALLSNQSIFLLGKPGIAKSLIARRLKYCFKNSINFEYLMNRFSTPDEIFGPISIKALEEGKYVRNIQNYLPSANIVFLDEIWKSSPAVLNSLLLIINEKIYKNGEKEIKVPLYLLISASNELPAKNEGLEALYDRFTIRYIAEGILKEKNFSKMISSITPIEIEVDSSIQISQQNYYRWLEEINTVQANKFLIDFLLQLRKKLAHEFPSLYVSDRRWKRIAFIIFASAYYNNRIEPTIIDCLVVPFCIWENYEDEVKTKKIFNNFFVENIKLELNCKSNFYNLKFKNILKQLKTLNLKDINFKKYNLGFKKTQFFRLYNLNDVKKYFFLNLDYFKHLQNNIDKFLKIKFYFLDSNKNYKIIYLKVKLDDHFNLYIKKYDCKFYFEQIQNANLSNYVFLKLIKELNDLKKDIEKVIVAKKDVVKYFKNQKCLFLNNYKNKLLNDYKLLKKNKKNEKQL